MKPVIVAFGSNIEPEWNLPEAIRRLSRRIVVEAASHIVRSPAVDSPGAPDFHNAAARVATELSPAALKHEVLRPLEAELGRRRGADKNAPRTLDLDLVLFGGLIVDDAEAGLRLPDPDLLTRVYVAVPAAELAPEFRHPLTGETLAAIARRLEEGLGEPLVRGPRLGEPPPSR